MQRCAIILTTDDVITINEHSEFMGYTRVLDKKIYDLLDHEGFHLIFEQWPYAHHTAMRCKIYLKFDGIEPQETGWTFLDVSCEDLKRLPSLYDNEFDTLGGSI